MQLSETNARTIGKVRDAYMNWRNSITSDSDLMEKLKKAANSNE
jgi:Mg2+ and Co2+ transporter CorA